MRGRWTALAQAVLLAGCAAESGTPAPPASPVPVSTVLVAAAGAQPLTASGTVRLKRETPLAFTTAGRLEALSAREGDRVAAGQPLARLDTGPVDAQAAAAEAEAARAEAELRRARTLVEQGWVSSARVEQAQAAVRAAAAQRSAARFNQRFARLTAPASGVVLRRLAEPGQTLAAGAPVLVLGELGSGFVVRLPLTDAQAAAVRLGQGATVRFGNGLPAMPARVTEIAGRADERTGTFTVDLRLPSDARLRSGMVASATLQGAPVAGAPLAVPAGALFAVRADEGFVYVVDGGRARARLVALGPVTDAGVVVTRGLRPGERIVRAGIDRLSDGAAVTVKG